MVTQGEGREGAICIQTPLCVWESVCVRVCVLCVCPCMHACVRACVRVSVCVRASVCESVCESVHACVCLCLCLCLCVSLCVSPCMHVCVCACVWVCVCMRACLCVCMHVSVSAWELWYNSIHVWQSPYTWNGYTYETQSDAHIVHTHTHTCIHKHTHPPQTAHKGTPSTWHSLHTHKAYKRKNKQTKRNCWTITYWNSANWCHLLQQWVQTVNTPALKKRAATLSLQQHKVTLPFHITNFEPVSKTFWTGCVHIANAELQSMRT